MIAKRGLIFGAVIVLAGCGNSGDLAITNESSFDIVVDTGEDTVEVSALGGVVILDTGCTSGDVTIEYPSGEKIVVSGPVCPERELVVYDNKVDTRP